MKTPQPHTPSPSNRSVSALPDDESRNSRTGETMAPPSAHVQPGLRLPLYLLSFSLLFSAGLLGWPNLSYWIQKQNTVALPDGALRLGTVYAERIKSQLTVTRVADNSELLTIEAQPDALYQTAVERILNNIRDLNDQAKASQGENFKAVNFDNAMWSDDVRVKLVTELEYQAEYQPHVSVVIDSHDQVVKKEKANIKQILSGIEHYGADQMNRYRKQFSFIRNK